MALPQAPTVFTVSPKFYDSGYITFTWSGAVAGDYPIAKYEIQYSSASDSRLEWDGWNKAEMIRTTNTYGTETSLMVNTVDWGCYTRYRIRTVDSMGNASPYVEASNYVIYGDPNPLAPLNFTANPATYVSGEITLAWEDAEAGEYPITGYEFQYATSVNGSTWGSWQALTTITSSDLSGSITTTKVNPTGNGYTRYRIRAKDSVGLYSEYANSNSVKTAPPPVPKQPTINAPVASKSIMNPRPRVLVTLNGAANAVVCDGYTASSTGNLTTGSKVVLRRSAALTGASTQTVSVKATDAAGGASSPVSRSYMYMVPNHSELTLAAAGTKMRALQITNLRTMVNHIRAYYTLAEKVWAEEVNAGATRVAGWAGNVAELRAAIQDIVNFVNAWDTASTVHRITLPTWEPIDTHKPTAEVINQLWEVLELL